MSDLFIGNFFEEFWAWGSGFGVLGFRVEFICDYLDDLEKILVVNTER
jgi:hypothetical protein